MLAAAALLVLTIPVLVAGIAQLRPREQRLWAGVWVVGLPLMASLLLMPAVSSPVHGAGPSRVHSAGPSEPWLEPH